jgi:hypothetical protein
MSLFLAGLLTDIFFFGLPIIDRIASPTAAVTMRLYSNLGVDLEPVTTHTPAIAADAASVGSCRLSRSLEWLLRLPP